VVGDVIGISVDDVGFDEGAVHIIKSDLGI
jgi:hypothetical protein